jgi:hypothetical protein
MVSTQREKGDFQALYSSDFPATEFLLHLAEGTKYFRGKDFEKAISEWEEAAELRPDYASTMRIVGNVSYQGSLDDVPLVGLFYAISSNLRTGVVVVRNEHAYKEVYFLDGWIVFARTNDSEERLGSLLVKRKLISQSHVEKLALQARKEGVKLGRFLVDSGLLLEKELREVLDFQIKEILCDLLSWQEGEFYFIEKKVEENKVVSYTPLEIALFAARRALDFSTFRQMVPHNKIIFDIPPSIESVRTKVMEELDTNETFIFSLINGKRNIDQLIKFSGDDEIFTIDILHRLLLMGLIRKSDDDRSYEDAEFTEVSQFLKTFLEVFKLVSDELKKELGVMAEEVLERARKQLGEYYEKIFYGLSQDGDIGIDINKILKNISVNYPHAADRLIFIDGFHGLIGNTLQEMKQVLGMPLTNKIIAEIGKVRGDVGKFCADSPAKSRVVDVLDRLVAQFSD